MYDESQFEEHFGQILSCQLELSGFFVSDVIGLEKFLDILDLLSRALQFLYSSRVLLLPMNTLHFLIRGLHDNLMHFAMHFNHQTHILYFPLKLLHQVSESIALFLQQQFHILGGLPNTCQLLVKDAGLFVGLLDHLLGVLEECRSTHLPFNL